ncbi:MAG: N-acetylmuramoyl-L-alanine amidase [Proteobacteria bacterium]|nr:N-acetylmuramoyl-L-alanine amidase [Pseudomonadota bacterium]
MASVLAIFSVLVSVVVFILVPAAACDGEGGSADGLTGDPGRPSNSVAKRSPRPVWLPSHRGHKLSPLAEAPPDWSELDQFQNSMTRADFIHLLDQVYAPKQVYQSFVSIRATDVMVRVSPLDAKKTYRIRFASTRGTRRSNAMGDLPLGAGRPGSGSLVLDGLTIAIDPGHIGGPWAKTEWRWFRIGRSRPVAEGDLTLRVAKLLADRLSRHGARVVLVRTGAEPVAEIDPVELEPIARAALVARGELYQGLSPAQRRNLIRQESARLAYRSAEIRARARRINRDIRPDLTVCIHFDAAPWLRATRPSLTDENHAHIIVNGSYTAEELEYEDVRFELLHRLLSRTHRVEMKLARSVAEALAVATGLPGKSSADTRTARRLSDDGYIWARNLLANRIYRGPVVYLEPYVQNNREVFARIQAGDYPGLRRVAGARRPSIFREYADAVTRGLVAHGSAPGLGNGAQKAMQYAAEPDSEMPPDRANAR